MTFDKVATAQAVLDAQALYIERQMFIDDLDDLDDPAYLAQVDLSPFQSVTAKIDRIDFRVRDSDMTAASLKELRRNIKGGTLVPPRGRRKELAGGPVLAIHDPSIHDLYFLTNRFYDAKVVHFEVAVDFKLPDGANDLSPLKILKAQLRHAMHPQNHVRLKTAKRKYFNLERKRYRDDGLGTSLPDGQIIWETPDYGDQMSLYIKQGDGQLSIAQPWVRMEARLKDSGPHVAGIGRLGMLADFAPRIRKHFADMFFVADGFKNLKEVAVGRGIPKDPWTRWGAQWTAGGRARLNPDNKVNRRIGLALNDLRTSLKRLKPPTAVAHRYDAWIDDHTY